MDQGQYDQAVAVYQEAVSRDSLSRDAHFYLGLAHLQRKSTAAAAHFARAIALDSTYIPSYHNLAIAHLEAGRYPQAVEAAEPRCASILNRLARIACWPSYTRSRGNTNAPKRPC